MRPRRPPAEKPVHWVGSSKRDLLEMPVPVRKAIGVALATGRYGGTHPRAKPWKGKGAGVLEAARHFSGDTFRAVYTVKFEKAVYVLHCFQKKSPSGGRTATPDVDLVHQRLKAAQFDYEKRYGKAKK